MGRVGGLAQSSPWGLLSGGWGGGFFPGAPGRRWEICRGRCLPAPQKSSHPRSKEGLLHSSCLKFLLNKSSGYRGIFQPGSRSQLSSPAGSRMHAGRKACASKEVSSCLPKGSSPSFVPPPVLTLFPVPLRRTQSLADCRFIARLSNLLCKRTPPHQAEPSPRRGLEGFVRGSGCPDPGPRGRAAHSDPRECPCHGDTSAPVAPLLGCHHPAPALPRLNP